ncbi:unnamed protein product [Peniophora sp. CBMAI 1063]|nr:unnamed protein product [Peniophora sp. CBMAI 1063]
MSSYSKDFTIAIVGGGFVGLVCAIGLAKAGVPVDVFEASSEYGAVGAGIGVGPNAQRVFEAMGIIDDLKDVLEDQGPPQSLFTFVKGENVHNVVYQYPSDKREDQGFAVHRGLFLKALAQLLPENVKQHFNKRCTAVSTTPRGSARIRFADGTEHVADIVIGADGIKSAVRASSTKEDRLANTLCTAYRGLVPMQRLLDAGVGPELLLPHARCWMGNDKHIIMYPVSNGTMLNIAAFTTDYTRPMPAAGPQSSWSTWVSPTTPADVLSAFSDFGPAAKSILGCMDSPNRWAVHGMYPPKRSYVGHAKDELEGWAMRVGRTNTVLIAKRQNLTDILQAYDKVRVPRGAYIANLSLRAGEIYHGRGPSGPSDAGRRKDLGLQWEGIWGHDVRWDVQRIVDDLFAKGVFGLQGIVYDDMMAEAVKVVEAKVEEVRARLWQDLVMAPSGSASLQALKIIRNLREHAPLSMLPVRSATRTTDAYASVPPARLRFAPSPSRPPATRFPRSPTLKPLSSGIVTQGATDSQPAVAGYNASQNEVVRLDLPATIVRCYRPPTRTPLHLPAASYTVLYHVTRSSPSQDTGSIDRSTPKSTVLKVDCIE